MGEHEATNLASRAFGMHKSGHDDCVGGAEASALPTIPTASITRVKCLDEHEFRKLLRFRREPSEESSGLPVDHVWGMVPEDPAKQARPPKQTLLRGSSAELDPARLGGVRSVKSLPGCRVGSATQDCFSSRPTRATCSHEAKAVCGRRPGLLFSWCLSSGLCLVFRDETAYRLECALWSRPNMPAGAWDAGLGCIEAAWKEGKQSRVRAVRRTFSSVSFEVVRTRVILFSTFQGHVSAI